MDPTRERIQTLKGKIASQSEFIDAALARAADEERELNDVELSNLEQARSTVEAHAAELEKLVKFHNAVAGADALAPVNVARGGAHTRARHDEPPAPSIGARFADSDQLRNYRAGTSASLELPDITPSEFALGRQTRATLTEGEQGAVWPDVIAKAGVVSTPILDKPRPLLQVISRSPTSLAAVPVLRVAADESGAAAVAEGDLKPEVTWTETLASVPVVTIAGHKKASRQILDDVAMVRNLIDTKLTRSVNNAVEAAVLTAVDAAITGANTTTDGLDLLSVIRNAVAALENRNHTANAVMLNPTDYAALDLTVLGQTLLGPVIGSQFWGLRVVSNPAVDAGTAYVGDFAQAVTLFERTGLNMFVTDSDISGEGSSATSDFRRNIITFLAELRAVPIVMDASALEAAVFSDES